MPILDIPALRENPFKARPLERGQSDLLVGRDDVSARWTRFIKARNARMILLIGESGSGRSSLMRCVSEETSKSVHLDMFPTSEHAHKILHEIYVSLIGFDVPSSSQELVSRLVNETENIEGPLPLISLDYSNVDGKQLSEILATLTAPLERLNALVVVVLSTEQRAQWPNNLVNRFDHADVISSLTKEEVRRLCETRISTASKLSWEMPEESLDYLFEQTSGVPTKVMRLMRDAVDYERANPRKIKYDSPQTKISESEPVENTAPDINVKEDEINVAFDLDLDELEKEPQVTYFEASEPINLPNNGPFKALAARNRINKQQAPPFDKTKATLKAREPDGVDANKLWIANQPNAMLVQEEEDVPFDVPIDESDGYVEQPLENYPDEITTQTNNDVEGLFGQLLEALNVPDGLSIAELLAAMRRPAIGNKESNPLDIHTLRSLSKNEAVLVEVASGREFSPSDARLQDRLCVLRPRMSQMCNRLYRAGILSVQQRGRSRMYKLTNDAKAQLVAWGMMEASV